MSSLRRSRAKTLTGVEEVAVSKVCEAFSKVVTTCGSAVEGWDLQNPENAAACTDFLQGIDTASRAMRVETAARDYRETFSVNYQILFPSDDRHYRLDILTACTEQYSGIWLNGERYSFGEEVTKGAEALMQAWTELLKTFGSWQLENKQQDKSELKAAMRAFDESWAHFEREYVLGLMHIEDQAKQLVKDAIQQEGKLREVELTCMDSDCAEVVLERSKFVERISQLNTVANAQRKGRNDLSDDILCDALKLWHGPEDASSLSLLPCQSDDCKNADESVKKVKSPSSNTSAASSIGGVANRIFGILRSVSNSSITSRSSSKVVKFFPESEDDDNDDDRTPSNTTAASSVGDMTSQVSGILRSVSNASNTSRSSSKVVRFFPESEDDDDDDRTPSNTTTASSVGGMTNRVNGILRSVSNSSNTSRSSAKVVRFFPEGEDDDNDGDCIDDAPNASTASTEGHSSAEPKCLASGEEQKQEVAAGSSSVQCLAGDVVESYWHIRYYLRDISNSLERIDPNLSNNSELVSRLEDWEESWEVGRDYVCDAEMLQIVCELVKFLKEAEKSETAFAEMIQECGAEFCLCVPRLVWLHFLQDPQKHMKLLQRFLPHHFSPITKDSGSPWSSNVHNLLCRYSEAEHEVAQMSKRVADEGCFVRRFLVQTVIAGPNSELQPDFATELNLGPKSDSNALVHAIEESSMELQRHQPEAWNHFMMVIVRCFSQGAPKPRQRMGPTAPIPKLQPDRGRRSLRRSRPRLRTMPFLDSIACFAGIDRMLS